MCVCGNQEKRQTCAASSAEFYYKCSIYFRCRPKQTGNSHFLSLLSHTFLWQCVIVVVVIVIVNALSIFLFCQLPGGTNNVQVSISNSFTEILITPD